MPQRIEFEGTIHEFPDDFTDEDIAAALGGGEPKPAAAKVGVWDAIKAGLSAVPAERDSNPLWTNKTLAGAAAEAPAMAREWATQVGPAVVGSAAVKLGGYAIPRVLGISGARAAQNLNSAAQAARTVPVNVEKAGQAGLGAMELVETGSRPVRVVERFVRRVTDPAKPPLTFEEARKFYSNISRLSANEYQNMNPTMARQVNEVRKALHGSLVEAAGTVGKGKEYAKGISEFARAKRAEEVGKKALKYGAGTLGLGAAYNYFGN